MTRRLASPLFLAAALSYYEVLTVALLDYYMNTRPRRLRRMLMPLALKRNFVTRPNVPPSSASSPHLTHLPFSVQRLRQYLWVERRGGTGCQPRARFRRGESGAREGAEGGGECGGGGGWLSDLSTTAHEVPLDVESGSSNRGVPGDSKEESVKTTRPPACE